MKIAFVCGFAWQPKGTVPLRAFPLAAELVSQGHQVAIFLPPYDNPSQSEKEWHQEGVEIKSLKVGRSALSYPGLLFRLLRAAREYRPDVTHVFKPKGFSGAVGASLLLAGVRSVAIDCDDWEGWGGWNDAKTYPWIVKEYIDRQERWMMRAAPAVTVASKALYSRVVQIRGDSDGVFYVPNCGVTGRDLENQRAVQRTSMEEQRKAFGLPNKPLIFYNGHFEPGDDIMFFCHAAAPVAERHQACMVFVGNGPDLQLVKDFFANRPGLEVRFFPRLPYDQFIRLVKAANITAFPYPDNALHRAKCSTRVIDYMALAKPVITTAVGQNLEYIVDGESGILAPPGDEVVFAEQLDLLLRNTELQLRLGRNAQERVSEKFRWSGEPLRQCLAAYRHLVPLFA